MGVELLQPYRGSQDDTVRALEELLADARAGHVIGIAYVILRQPRLYVVGLAGETRRSAIDATFARGMVRALDDELKLIVRGFDSLK